jgi:hypothetical protein
MTPADRRAIILQQEGAALNAAGMMGDDGAERTRCLIDGLANALVRIDGTEAAAGYLFALSDRVAGGLRDPTDYRALPAPVPPPCGGRGRSISAGVDRESDARAAQVAHLSARHPPRGDAGDHLHVGEVGR